MTKLILFKVGKQTNSAGVTDEYTADMLRDVATTYKQKVAENPSNKIPLVYGHPKHDDESHGWFDDMNFEDATGELSGDVSEVDDATKEKVQKGGYRRLSISFYKPESTSNPAQGKLFPRHVGLLGASAPGVTGLPVVSFSDDEDGVVSYGDYEAEKPTKAEGILQRLGNFIAKQFGKEQADQIMFGEAVEAMPATETAPAVVAPAAEAAPAAETPTAGAEFSEGQATAAASETQVSQEAAPGTTSAAPAADFSAALAPAAEPAALTVDFAAHEARIAAREAELAEREQALRDAEIASFCEGVIAAGKVTPGLRSTVTTLFKTLSESGSIEFAEGESRPAANLLKDLLNSLPVAVTYSEVATDESGPAPTQLDFAVAPGYTVDQADLAKLAKAKAYQAEHPELTLIQAFSKI